jgi:class 3 adenylate cyclase
VQLSPAIHHTIVAVDIADFTNPARTELHQAAMQNGLYQVLQTAFDEAGVHWTTCDVEDRGDGVLILVPPQFSKVLLVDQLSNRLVAGLSRYNAVHAPEATIQLRVALHSGEVRREPEGKVGKAVNNVFRILDAAAAKIDLLQSKGVLAVIASDTFYHEVIKVDPATGPTYFREIPVAVKHTKTTAWLRILGTIAIGEQSRVLDVFPPEALERLRELLGETTVPQLPMLLARAVSSGVPPMGHGATAWEAVQYLLDFNAGPDGFPQVMTFLELLARQTEATLAASLMAWNDAQAQRLRLTQPLKSIRDANTGPVSNDLHLHLMILIEHHGLDSDEYQVSHWRQDDPLEWPPARGETRIAVFDELEGVVDELIMNAEAAWSGYQGDVALEFVLPRSLINLPVDRWRSELNSSDPRPLSLDYPIVVRSLERMLAQRWHRVWQNKWHTLVKDPFGARVYLAAAPAAGQGHGIDVDLKDPQVVSMVLRQAPTPEPGRQDEFAAALRAGLPVVLWSRQEDLALDLHKFATQLAESGGVADLPRHVLSARQAALAGTLDQVPNKDVIENLVLLWENPRRMAYLDQPPHPARLEGDTANERERAS